MQRNEENKKVISLEEAKMWRFVLRVAFFLIAFVGPSVIIAVKFQLFSNATIAKWSITALCLLLIVGWRFKERLKDWIDKWENDNILKHILVAIGKIWPFILIVCILGAFKLQAQKISKILDDTLFCLQWTCVCELFSYLVLYPIEMKMDYLVKRMIRKNERKADYKEAIREMNEGESEDGE